MKSYLVVLTTILVTLFMPLAASACGSETRCQIGDRHYYIALPDSYRTGTPIPALIFAHGFQGSALGIIRNPRLRKVANDLGIAFIAVKSLGQSWSTNNSPRSTRNSQAIELAYFDAVKKDITSRFSIDPKKVVMSGASTGGMVTWTLACERSDAFAGFIPMSGTFWGTVPRRCKGRVANIVHFHGDKDKTVPLNGRPVAGTHQGSVPKALAMYRAYGDFEAPRKHRVNGLRCENSLNSARNIVNFCLYDGGHSFRSSNITVAWRMFKAAGKI